MRPPHPERATRANPTLSARSYLKVVEVATDSGVEIEPHALALFRRAGRDDDPDRRVPCAALWDLWEAVMVRAREPGLPTRVGAAKRIEDYHVLGLACLTCATFDEAVRRASRYSRVWSDWAYWRLEPGAPGAPDARYVFVHPDAARLGQRCAVECAAAEMLHAGRLVSGVGLRPLEARFRHAAPRDTTELRAHFGAPVVFGAERTELVVPRAVLSAPLPRADPALDRFVAGHAEAFVHRHAGASRAIAARVELAVARELGAGVPTLEALAPTVGMSPRTLRRRLAEEGTTFQQLVERTRRELAEQHLAAGRLALGEIAFLVGFSEQSAFQRAFKRWTGVTPREYRGARQAGVRASR